MQEIAEAIYMESVKMNDIEKIIQKVSAIEGYLTILEASCLILEASLAERIIVEIGAYRGKSTVALAAGAYFGEGAVVYSIDPHEPYKEGMAIFGYKDQKHFLKNLVKSGFAENVRIINLKSEIVASMWERGTVDLLWIDGDHEYREVQKDFDLWSCYVENGKILIHDRNFEGPKEVIEKAKIKDFIETEVIGTISILERRKKCN